MLKTGLNVKGDDAIGAIVVEDDHRGGFDFQIVEECRQLVSVLLDELLVFPLFFHKLKHINQQKLLLEKGRRKRTVW